MSGAAVLSARRDEVAAVVTWGRITTFAGCMPVLRNAIDYIIDLDTIQQTRTIETAEELDKLPAGSVIRFMDIMPTVAEKDDEGTWMSTRGDRYAAWDDPLHAPVPGSATVLYEPAVQP